MKTSVFIVFIMLVFSSSVFGQRIEDHFSGEWFMSKAVLVEEPLDKPERKTTKEYTKLPQEAEHFLLNQCVTKVSWVDEVLNIEICSRTLNEPYFIEENDYFSIKDGDGDTLGPYFLTVLSEDELSVKTFEVFYNSKPGIPMKAVLSIHLKRNNL